MTDITYSITKQIGIVSEGNGGWKKELNMVSWNNREPKLDLRDWSQDHGKMGKGVTLTREEAQKLAELLGTALKT